MRRSNNSPIVTTLSVTITIIFYTVFTRYVSPLITGIPGLGFVVGILASVGFYVSLFQIITWIYFRFIQDIIDPKEKIVGEWFYRLDIRGQENNPRYGLCEICRHAGEICVTGIHYHPKEKKFTSRFSSDFVIIEGHSVIVMYTSVGVDEETFMRKGVFFLSTEGVPPQRIYGVWTDVLPNRNAGDMVFQKRDKHTDAILTSVGYPVGSSELQKILNTPLPSPAIGSVSMDETT